MFVAGVGVLAVMLPDFRESFVTNIWLSLQPRLERKMVRYITYLYKLLRNCLSTHAKKIRSLTVLVLTQLAVALLFVNVL